MIKKSHVPLMFFGFFGILGVLLAVVPAWSQTVCGPDFIGNPNFCHFSLDDAFGKPSPPATGLEKPPQPTVGYPVRFVFTFLCNDAFTGRSLDCGYSIQVLKLLDPNPTVSNTNNGGHLHASPPRPLIEPSDRGTFIFAGVGSSSGTVTGSPLLRPGMEGRTGQSVAVLLYPVPQASGDLLIESFVVLPPGYLCASPGCFDQVPVRHGLNRMQFLTALRVGIPIDGQFTQLTQTADAPFVLRQGPAQLAAHPENHFGTATAVQRITQIAQRYRKDNPGLGKLGINDISLVRGGVYDLKLQWSGDNQDNPHWGHRTGTEADINTKDSENNDTSCTAGGGGNDLVKNAVKAVIPKRFIPTVPQGATPLRPRMAHKCEARQEPGGRNHVYLQ
ncbi:MAG: hypothetical protein ACREI9_03825 [Nitrospiraceae bacterium]